MSNGKSIIQYKLGNQFIDPPANQEDVTIELNFDPDDPDALEVTVTNGWDFVGQAGELINKQIEDGKIPGNIGITEGIPYSIFIKDDVSRIELLRAFIDLMDSDSEYECDRADVRSMLRNGVDSVAKRLKSTTFRRLLVQKKFTAADYIQIPYVISRVPNYLETAIAIITGYVVLKELRDLFGRMSDIGADFSSVIGIIAALIKIFFAIVAAIIILIVLIELIIQIKDTLIQPVKYHAGMRLKKLLELAAEDIGLKFKSSVFNDSFYRDTIIIPSKFEAPPDPTNDEIRGYVQPSTTTKGYYRKSGFDLMIDYKRLINGKTRVSDRNELIIERRDFNPSTPKWQMPLVEVRGKQYNTNELISNIEIVFRTDITDANTFDNFEGTTSNTVTLPVKVTNKDLVNFDGLKTIQHPFARCSRKNSLTAVEKRLDKLFKNHTKSINKVIKLLNKIIKLRNKAIKIIKKIIKALRIIGIKLKLDVSSLPPIPPITPQTIEDRIGMMLLENDYFEVDKIGSFDIASSPRQTEVKVENQDRWNAGAQMDEFYFIDLFTPRPGSPDGNQWQRFRHDKVPFCKEDFVKMLNNNFFTDHNKRPAKLESLKWNTFDKFAEVAWRVNLLYTRNTKDETDVSDGL